MTEYTAEETALMHGLSCPPAMALIPGGQVRSLHEKVWNNEKPPMGKPRQVPLFCMDRFEYPNQRFVSPRVHVSWFEARQLCREQGKRLCREDEWELACTMGREWDYCYGPKREIYRCNSDHPVGTMEAIAPAGSRLECRNRYGVFDLNGNVSEWIASTDATIGPSVGILRGGTAWTSAEYGGDCWSRHGHPQNDVQYTDDGFRCCADPEGG